VPEQKLKLKALLADDEEQYTTAYGMFLEDLGFSVTTVMDKDALLGAAGNADVLIVDVCLPSDEKMEGIEAVASLVGEQRVGPAVPIIFISGYKDDTPKVRKRLQLYPDLKGRYRWVWKDDEFEVLADAIEAELARLLPR
jgi:CheY-like chemotaxis protein